MWLSYRAVWFYICRYVLCKSNHDLLFGRIKDKIIPEYQRRYGREFTSRSELEAMVGGN